MTEPNGSQPVRDDDDGSIPHDLQHVLLNNAFAFVVQRACRLIEDQNRRITRKRTRDRKTLSLTAGEVGPALLYYRVISAWDVLTNSCAPANFAQATTCPRESPGFVRAILS